MDRAISLEARRIDLSIELPFQLGRTLVDPAAHESTIRGRLTHIQPQMLKVLVALHDKIGHVVTREELIDRCWDGRIVGDDVLNRCVSLLRRLAQASGDFEIETVPRAGYRLVEAAPGRRPRHLWMASGAAFASLVGLAAWAWLAHAPIRQGLPPAPVVTVVPFTADANDPVERQVAKAAPVSIAHMLSESGFPIVFGKPQAAGGSDFVISGSVRRIAGKLEATVQMNATHGGTMAFSHDFSSPLARSADLPDQIGAALAAELAWTGAEMLLDRRRPLDPQIASELMQAMRLTIEEGDSLRAYQIDRRVAPMAPDSAIAQLTLAVDTGFAIDSIPRDQRAEAVAIGRQAAARALALAPEFGDVYITWCLLHSPVRRAECEARLRQGERIDPSSSFVPGALSALFYNAGRIDDSVALARVSLANDPYKPAKLARMIRMLEVAGRGDEAVAMFNEASRLWPDSGRMRAARLQGMADVGDYEGIVRFADRAEDSGMVDVGAADAVIAARRDHDVALARRTCDSSALKPFTLSLCMTILADLRNEDRAFALASRLYPSAAARAGNEEAAWLDDPQGYATAVLATTAGRSMRKDPRFMILADRLGLIGYWRAGRLPDFCTKAHEPVCARIPAPRT